MSAMASQITSFTIVYSTVYSGADQRKHQGSTSLAFVWGNSPVTGEFPAYQGPATHEMFPFDDVIMNSNPVFEYTLTRFKAKSEVKPSIFNFGLIGSILTPPWIGHHMPDKVWGWNYQSIPKLHWDNRVPNWIYWSPSEDMFGARALIEIPSRIISLASIAHLIAGQRIISCRQFRHLF